MKVGTELKQISLVKLVQPLLYIINHEIEKNIMVEIFGEIARRKAIKNSNLCLVAKETFLLQIHTIVEKYAGVNRDKVHNLITQKFKT